MVIFRELKEAKILFGKRHPNIVEVYGYIGSGLFCGIVMEYAPCKDLHTLFLSKDMNISWQLRLQIISQIINGLVYLHTELKLVHRDLKSQNIVLSNDLTVKIADFGTVRFIKTTNISIDHTKHEGTPGYIAPERFDDSYEGTSAKEDMYRCFT